MNFGKLRKIVSSAGTSVSNSLTKSFSGQPAKGKAIDKATSFFGGDKIKALLSKELENEALIKSFKKELKSQRKLDILLNKTNPLSKKDIGQKVREFAVEQGGPSGNFVQRQIKHTADDFSHPILNTKKTLMNMLYTYSPETGLVARSNKGIAGQAALTIGFPAWMASGALKDKELSPGSRTGRATSYAALPFVTRRFVPSMVAYTAADKIFKGKAHEAVRAY